VMTLIGIFALTLGLAVLAVRARRESAMRADSMNRLRQISLGFIECASNFGGRLPQEGRDNPPRPPNLAWLEHYPGEHESRFEQVLIFLQHYRPKLAEPFLSPADPTVDRLRNRDQCSYALNWQIFG